MQMAVSPCLCEFSSWNGSLTYSITYSLKTSLLTSCCSLLSGCWSPNTVAKYGIYF